MRNRIVLLAVGTLVASACSATSGGLRRAAEAGFEPGPASIIGTWQRTEPNLNGMSVQARDVIWEGDIRNGHEFHLMARVGLGEVRVWRSINGIDWAERPQLGVVGVLDGPTSLFVVDGRLMAGGDRDGVATVWIYESASPWREVSLGMIGSVRDLREFNGTFFALGSAPTPGTDAAGFPQTHALLWATQDLETWTELAGSEMFGPTSQPIALLEDSAGLHAIAETTDPDAEVPRESIVVASGDGIEWHTLPREDRGAVGVVLVRTKLIPDPESDTGWIEHHGDAVMPTPGRFGMGLETAVALERLLMVGSITYQQDGVGSRVNYPGLWSHTGVSWEEIGPLSGPVAQPGSIAMWAAGEDRIVVVGQAGSKDDGWAIFSFVQESDTDQSDDLRQ